MWIKDGIAITNNQIEPGLFLAIVFFADQLAPTGAETNEFSQSLR
ncbi:hypothetical protein ACLB1S_24070 [Escherichia coli]